MKKIGLLFGDTTPKILYHIGHMGMFIHALLHKLVYHKNDETIFILDAVIANSFFIDYISENADKFSQYGKIFIRNDRDILNFNGTDEEYENYITDYFDGYFEKNKINVSKISKIYLLFDTYNAFGCYLSIKKIHFDLIEIFSRQCQNRNRYYLNNNKLYDSLIDKYSALSGDNAFADKIWCFDKENDFNDKCIDDISQFSLINRVDAVDLEALIETYGIDCSSFKPGKYCEIIFNSGFIMTYLKSPDDGRNYYLFLYQLMADYFKDENHNLLIKPHPNTDFPMDIWLEYFPDAYVLPGYFPSALTEHLPGLCIDMVINTGSTGVDKNDNKSLNLPYRILMDYKYSHKFYFSSKIIRFIGEDMPVYVNGIDMYTFNAYLSQQTDLSAQYTGLGNSFNGSVVVFANISWNSGLDYNLLKQSVLNSDNCIFLFLNSPNRYFFEELSLDKNDLLTIRLQKNIIRSDCMDCFEDEYIYIYSDSREMLERLLGFNEYKELKYTGETIQAISQNYTDQRFLIAGKIPQIQYNNFNDFNNTLNALKRKTLSFQNKKLIEANNVVYKDTCFSDLKDGRVDIIYNEVKFEGVYKSSIYDKLYVLLSSGVNDKSILPVFHRWTYSSFLDGHMLCLADPMYAEYYSKGLRTGWYYGTEEKCYLDYVAEITKALAKHLNILNKNIIFYGSSSGGYASIYCASQIPGCVCIAINSQINLRIEDVHKNKFEESVGIKISENDRFGRNDLSDKIIQNDSSYFILMENARSGMDMKRIKYLCDKMGVDFYYGVQRLKDNVTLLVYDSESTEDAHNTVDTRRMSWVLANLANDRYEDIDKIKSEYQTFLELWGEGLFQMRQKEINAKSAETNLKKYENVSYCFADSSAIGEKLLFILKILKKCCFDTKNLYHYGIHNSVIWSLTAFFFGKSFNKSVWSDLDFPDDSVTIVNNIYWNPGNYAEKLNKNMISLPDTNNAVIFFLNKISALDCFNENTKLSEHIVQIKISESQTDDDSIFIFSKSKDAVRKLLY